jgi:3-deoxy-D-manno-octulosonic-acid transferase
MTIAGPRVDFSRFGGWPLLVYGSIMTAMQPLFLMKLWWRARREPQYGLCVWQRFGFGYPRPEPTSRKYVWLHSVSLGETRAAAVLVNALRQADPSIRFVLTQGTATGWVAAQALLQEGDIQVWAPWDAPRCVRRFMAHFSLRCGLVMETEVWPLALREAQRARIPMALINARMSPRSLARALPWIGLLGPAFASFVGVLAQSEADAQRLKALGAQACRVVGNLKFDMRPNAGQLAVGRHWAAGLRRPVVVLTSSREGEEAQWLKAWQRWRETLAGAPPVHWLIVPRHPNRFDEVETLLQGHGLIVSRRSAWMQAGPQAEAQAADVWLGDSMGEMSLYYGLSDVALLGGSYAPLGGQNLIEAVNCGCVVVAGPHTFNFAQATASLVDVGAVRVVKDIDEAIGVAVGLVEDGAMMTSMRQAGERVTAQSVGAVDSTICLIAQYVSAHGCADHD